VTSDHSSALTQAVQVLFEEGTFGNLTDRQLLERFATGKGEAAFGALVARHGPMVLNVCETVLGNSHDAEDAFQASFLILAKKSRSIRNPDLLGNWLYGVARRTAQKARARRTRSRRREAGEGVMAHAAVVLGRAEHELVHREQIAALYEEVDRLPRNLRGPIVLCYLEGLTHHEAARHLRWPVGTVRSRMARGRNVLEARLNRRGLAFEAMGAAIEAGRAAMVAVPHALASSTARSAIALATGAAPGLVSREVLTLIEEVLRAMFVTKLMRIVAAAFAILCVATATAGIVAERKANNPAQTDVKQQARLSPPKQVPRTGDHARRARELIYFFRNYRVFVRDEEWAQTIRELVTIGRPAVPELVAELDRTDRHDTLRSLAFTLRAIGDPRAVPGLIRAIPKGLRSPRSDCGIHIADPELRAFMKAHQNYRGDQDDSVLSGRPVNEIISALERITTHREPTSLVGDNDPLRGVFLGGNPEQQAKQRALYEERQKLWQAWWSKHWQEFATREELQSAELRQRDVDLVEKDGLDRNGPLFPTGAQVRLGPIHMLRLTRSYYWNAESHLDFDTGRVFEHLEGTKTADSDQRVDFGRWYHQNGIDVRCQGPVEGSDLQLWLVDDRRWETIEAEIQQGGTLELGRETTEYLVRFRDNWTDFKYDELATFLFTTREGGRGIVQVFPKDQKTDQYRIRYRMWETVPKSGTAQSPSAQRAGLAQKAKRTGTRFGTTVTAILGKPGEGQEFLLNLQTAGKAVPPKFLSGDEIMNSFSLSKNNQFIKWCREQGISVLNYVNAEQQERQALKVGRPLGQLNNFGLIAIDMREARILPQSFDELTVEDAREIMERVPEQKSASIFMLNFEDLAERPDTFAFKTRAGTVGLLQFEPVVSGPGKLAIRYKLERAK
jgi:RNA polymerase sigma factor (sigma-70 family)